MATILPPPTKRQKLQKQADQQVKEENTVVPEGLGNVRVQFVEHASGNVTGAPVSIPIAQASTQNIELLLNSLRGKDEDDGSHNVPYHFSFRPSEEANNNQDTIDITNHLYHAIVKPGIKSTEDVIRIWYTPQAVFRVRAVTRCSAAVSGHGQAILATQFSPKSSSRMVSGSGDGTARIWDCDTGTAYKVLKGHTSWVLAVSYSPDGEMIATGGYDNTIRIWKSAEGEPFGGPLKGHTKWITALAWEPYHLQAEDRRRIASASKDCTARVWDVVGGKMELALTAHKGTVSCIKWSGTGRIYTSSHDKTIKIWDSQSGSLLQDLSAHAHWVNHLALSTDHVLRTGFFDPNKPAPPLKEDRIKEAKRRFENASRVQGRVMERLVSASDDCTIYLWDTTDTKKPMARLLGHQKQVNHVTFSPDGLWIASCGFDNAVKLWRAEDGKYKTTLRGHVAPVYQCCFSADSRLLVSASKDTTLKAWDVASGKLLEDLPGHKDEVFAVDWSPDGKRVGSGSKDKAIRIWTN